MIVTIKAKHKLFKQGVEATSIECLELEEYGFNIVSGIDNFQVGEKAVYIEPDFNLPTNELFLDYIQPNGDPKKSKLGSNNRIRAIKFNFNKENSSEVVYSNGVLLPWKEVQNFTSNMQIGLLNQEQIYAELGITKYETPDEKNSGTMNNGQSAAFPKGWYRTDETNFMKICNSLTFPQTFVGTQKQDGSSGSISSKYICSRNQSKPLIVSKVVGTRDLYWWEKAIKFFNKKYRPDISIKEIMESDSDFVIYGKKYYNLLNEKNLHNIVLRGEYIGSKFKGSGNKKNPSFADDSHIEFYGIDNINEAGITEKVDYLTFRKIVESLDLPTVKEVFNRQFESKEDLLKTCQEYFKTNLIEGIVCRSLDSTISFKVMSEEYDSKK